MTTTDESRYMEELMEKVGEGDSEAMYDLALSYLPTAFDVKDPGSYTKGLSLLQQAVNGNNTEAMFKLAEAYLAPRYGLTQDYTKAMSLLQQAIAGNNTKAMVKLAGFYLGTTYLPETVPCKGPAEGVLLLEQAIARNNTEAMLILAEGYLEPKYGLTQDHNKGVSLLLQAVSGNNTQAMVKLADAYLGPAYGLPQDDRKAMSLLQLAVERGSAGASFMVDLIRKVDSGDTNAMCVLARCFLDRRCGGLPNSPKGISLLQRAVVGHNTNAMVELSRCYLEPKNGFTQITTQITEGISLLKQASEGGNHEAMSDLACMYMKGENGLPIHLRKAMHLFQAANDDCGLCNIGDAYKRNHDMERAVRAWTLAADRKNEPAMCSLGWCYQHGVGVERDQRKAVSLYKAPEWVRPVSLGVCYLLGEGVRRNWTKAVSLFQRSNTGKSAFNDGKPACNDGTPYLGWCYLWGCGVDRDVGEALGILNSASKDYCRAAAFLGYFYERGVGDLKKARVLYDDISDYGAEALGELGVFCQRGDCGAPMDKELAVKYFKMAAEGGDIISMFHLGVCLRDGDGVERDMDQSRRWLEEAALCGHRGAAKILHPEEMQQQGRVLHHRTVQLENHCHEVEATLAQERISVANLNKSLKAEVDRSTSFQDIINTMTSLITATAPDFRVEKLLGTGSHAAAFKVQYLTAFDNNSIRSSALTTSSTTTKRGRDMVMKVLFNWENTPQQTMLRQKYMAECVTLSLVPNHPNIIHPLGAIVIPGLPSEYVEKIPSDKSFFRNELCTHKSLAILMPHAGITLGEFLCALLRTSSNKEKILETVLMIFVQGTKAIQHIEAHSIVHRDIKQDNILIAPESGKLTLIDFGEAQQCCPPNMEMMITATTQSWGNAGTMPPELSMFLKATATTRGGPARAGPALFSLSKCDSFALALTFWDALLPQSHKFIGSTMNHDMSLFNTKSLLDHFPIPLFSSLSSSSSLAARSLESAMIGMMNPDKNARVSASDAISSLV